MKQTLLFNQLTASSPANKKKKKDIKVLSNVHACIMFHGIVQNQRSVKKETCY